MTDLSIGGLQQTIRDLAAENGRLLEQREEAREVAIELLGALMSERQGKKVPQADPLGYRTAFPWMRSR